MSRHALLTEVSATTDLAVRAPAPGDRAAVIAMHDRCSAHSIRQRWHGPRHDLPEPYLTEALAGLPTHIALLALDGPRVVALASAVQQDREEWEIGVLVVDAWQRRGVATTLVGAIAQRVAARGGRRLSATALQEQAALLGPPRTTRAGHTDRRHRRRHGPARPGRRRLELGAGTSMVNGCLERPEP